MSEVPLNDLSTPAEAEGELLRENETLWSSEGGGQAMCGPSIL